MRAAIAYATALPPLDTCLCLDLRGTLRSKNACREAAQDIRNFRRVFSVVRFSSLKWGWHPGWYLVFQGVNAIISGPIYALITKVKLTNLPNASKSFPIYSMFGTIGWILGGLLTSQLGLDWSADAGLLAAYIRFVMGVLCFLLPATPPTDFESRGWRARLGLNAFGLLKIRELRVFYITSMLFASPCMAFFMIVPTMLVTFGATPDSTNDFWADLEIL